MTEEEHDPRGESSPPKDTGAKLVWREVFSALYSSSEKTGIPSTAVEWKNDDDKPLDLPDGEYSMNIKPIILGPDRHPMVVVANIYRSGVHVEMCGVMAFWQEDVPIIVTAPASPADRIS